jgi:tetratricopeptide (TPR) repeat protein
MLFGMLQDYVGKASYGIFEEAIWTAEVARHDEVVSEAAAHLVFMAGEEARFDIGEIWSRHAEAVLRRMGGHELVWGMYYDSRGCMRQQQGRLSEAIEDARLAVAAKERALGADSAEVGISLGNLANHMAYCTDFDGALGVNRRAVEILAETLGRDHPRTALVLGNRAQFLCRLGRFQDAMEAALSALAVSERETDPRGPLVTLPLRTLGLCYLGMGRSAEALTVLERAMAVREAKRMPPLRLAEVRAPLARAVLDSGGDPARAVALAQQALGEYAQAASTPVVARDRAELERWLAARTPPP